MVRPPRQPMEAVFKHALSGVVKMRKWSLPAAYRCVIRFEINSWSFSLQVTNVRLRDGRELGRKNSKPTQGRKFVPDGCICETGTAASCINPVVGWIIYLLCSITPPVLISTFTSKSLSNVVWKPPSLVPATDQSNQGLFLFSHSKEPGALGQECHGYSYFLI